MAKLSTKSRNALPKGDFAGPDRSYPVNDRAHAIAAKARATQFASPAEKAKIDAKANRVLGTKSTAKELDRRLWSPESFRQKHNQKLSPEAADKAARMANAILKRGGSEKIAISTANKHGDQIQRELNRKK